MNAKNKSLIKTILSIINKLLVVVFVAIGVGATFAAETLGGSTALLYFTIQSNLWIGGICLVFAILQIIGIAKNKNYITNLLYILKFMFTTSITLTFVVMSAMLTPVLIQEGNAAYLAKVSNIFPHYLVPIFSVADFFLFDTAWDANVKYFGYGAIMPVYYLIFALSLGAMGVAFNEIGETYPYFFLDYEALGLFSGINPNGKYGGFTFGMIWWIIIVALFVLVMSTIYILLLKSSRKSKLAAIPFIYEINN